MVEALFCTISSWQRLVSIKMPSWDHVGRASMVKVSLQRIDIIRDIHLASSQELYMCLMKSWQYDLHYDLPGYNFIGSPMSLSVSLERLYGHLCTDTYIYWLIKRQKKHASIRCTYDLFYIHTYMAGVPNSRSKGLYKVGGIGIEKLILHLRYEAGPRVNHAVHKLGASIALAWR